MTCRVRRARRRTVNRGQAIIAGPPASDRRRALERLHRGHSSSRAVPPAGVVVGLPQRNTRASVAETPSGHRSQHLIRGLVDEVLEHPDLHRQQPIVRRHAGFVNPVEHRRLVEDGDGHAGTEEAQPQVPVLTPEEPVAAARGVVRLPLEE